ncbi:MAG: nitronate monooxygenase [Firmicutes bacterium]|nr:nitronate monooxygenase [Bacillota bacterium]
MTGRRLGARLTRILGVMHPVIQGGMAWVADAQLAAAVSRAGGLGVIASAHLTPDQLRAEIHTARRMTDKPFGVNIMLMSPNAGEAAQICCEERVAVVTTGAGHPGEFMERFSDAGIIVMPVVASTAQAKRAASVGAHAVIAEGYEAGGHVGELTTMALVPQVVDAVDLPVVAAGGIADGRGAAAAFCLGASGVQLGTAFVVARECTAHPNYKRKVLAAADSDTQVTGRSVGHPVRALKNRFTRELARLEREGADPDTVMSLGVGSLARAVRDGDVDQGSVMVGQIAGLLRQERTALAIVTGIMQEAERVLASVGVLGAPGAPDALDALGAGS